ncbi:MAG: hypothetical protein R3B57_06515 [Phycisphaerales bacterium]
MPLPPGRADTYTDWLKQITMLPTAAGHERRVVAWIERWVNERDDLTLTRDGHNNLTLAFKSPDPAATQGPIYFTAHLDHPAFVVRDCDGASLTLEFRGGVMDDYFPDAPIIVHTDDTTRRAVITERVGDEEIPFKLFRATLDDAGANVSPGDIATWQLPAPEVLDAPDEGPPVEGGVLFTSACDDLAAVAAALSAIEELRLTKREGKPVGDIRVLFTLAEEIGFVGAIAACRNASIPKTARLICLENSRSFPTDSPIGAGPIVRVGDRVSVFTPELTAAVASVAESLAGKGAHPLAIEKQVDSPFRWQRKLMPGGACEASVFCAFGYSATCVCLPLGNYHNMADLAAVQAKTNTARPRVGREHIAIRDFLGLVELLAAAGLSLPDKPSFREKLDKLWDERRFVLEEGLTAEGR